MPSTGSWSVVWATGCCCTVSEFDRFFHRTCSPHRRDAARKSKDEGQGTSPFITKPFIRKRPTMDATPPQSTQEAMPQTNRRQFRRSHVCGRRPSSRRCALSIRDGALVKGSAPDCVLGKAITSRMLVSPAKSATNRSMPKAKPA